MSVRHQFSIVLSLLLLVIGGGGIYFASTLWAQAPAEQLRYRKILVDKDDLDDLVHSRKRKFMTMSAERFKQLLGASHNSNVAPEAVQASIENAVYSARLSGDQLVDGVARLQVLKQGSEIASLQIDACKLALTDANWEATPPATEPHAALLGLAPDGSRMLEVASPGTLLLDWSLQGQRTAMGDLLFKLGLPRCPANELHLELPEGLIPSVDSGMATLLEEEKEGDSPPETPSPRKWRILLGGGTERLLRLSPVATEEPPAVLVRRRITYDLTERGATMAAELRLTGGDQRLSQFIVRMEPGLQLLGARMGETTLPHTQLSDSDRYLVSFPEPLAGVDRSVQLTAVSPLPLNEVWRLPTFVLEGSDWLEGSVVVQVHEPLEIEQLETDGRVQSAATALAGAEPGESLRFQSTKRDGFISVQLRRREPHVECVCLTSIRLGAASIAGRMVVDLKAKKGDVFELEAYLPQSWIIDAIDAEPVGVLGDWSIPSRGARRQLLRLRFDRAITDTRPVRLRIRAYQRAPALGESLSFSQLRMATFRGVEESKRIVGVDVEPPFQMDLAGDGGVRWLDESQLTEAEQEVLALQRGGLTFADDTGAGPLAVSLRSEGVRYSGQVRALATIVGDQLRMTYKIRCRPEASQIDRLRVRFSQESSQPVRWTLQGEPVDAVKLPPPSDADDLMEEGESWEIVLPPQDESFELLAERTLPLNDGVLLSLPSLPEATAQTGLILIGAEGADGVRIRHPQLRAIPPADVGGNMSSPVRSVLAYQPSQNVGVFVQRADSRQASLWAWSCDFSTQCGMASSACTATYRLENWGASAFAFRLPDTAGAVTVHVGNEEVEPELAGDSYLVPLPKGDRFPLVQIKYLLSTPSSWGLIRPHPPQTDTAVLSTRWNVWIPPGYQVAEEAREQPLQRLLGPLLRSRRQGPFRVFSSSDWGAFVGAEEQVTAQFRLDIFARALAGAVTRSKTSTTPDTWGDFLAHRNADLQAESPEDPPLLLIDQHALASCGITPSSPLLTITDEQHIADGNSSEELGHVALRSANLTLLAWPRGVVLTTQLEASRLADQWRPISPRVPMGVVSLEEPGELSASLRGETHFITAGDWLRTEGVESQPWRTPTLEAFSANAAVGWSVHQRTGSDLSNASLRIYKPSQIRALGWSALLILAAISAWALRGRPRLRAVVCIVFGSLALVVPPPYTSIASGAFLGVLAGCLLGWVWRLVKPNSQQDPDDTAMGVPQPNLGLSGATTTTRFATLFLALLVWSICATNQAQQPPESVVYEVIIPVDKNRESTGYYQVERPLHDALESRAEQGGGVARSWLIKSVTYVCELARTADSVQNATVSRFYAEYELEVRQANSKIVLPYDSTQMTLLESSGLLNGASVEIETDPMSNTMSLQLGDMLGPATLRLPIFPITQSEDDVSSFSFPAPPSPKARLVINAPPDIRLQASSSLGASDLTPMGDLVLQLGPVDQVELAWPANGKDSSSGAEVRVDQLTWIKYRRNSVTYDAKFTWLVPQGKSLESVRIVVDPRLKLLKPSPAQPLVGAERRIESEAGPSIIQFELDRAYQGEEVSLQLGFISTDDSGIGASPVYQLSPADGVLTENWLALSAASNLVLQLESSPSADSRIAVSDFAGAWGEDAQTPLEAYRMSPTGSSLLALLTPHPSATVADTEQWVSLDHPSSRVLFHADLKTSFGERFQQHLLAPGVEIQSISVTQNGKELVKRWSQAGDGATAFFSESIAGAYRIVVEGRLPTLTSESRPRTSVNLIAPLIQLADVDEVQSQRLRVYHRPAIALQTSSPEVLSPVETEEANAYEPAWGRLAGDWYTTQQVKFGRPVHVAMKVALNRPRVSCVQVTTLRREDAQWAAEVDCRVNVARGSLDAVRFDAPPEWAPPFQVDIPAEITVTTIPGRVRKRLVVRPKQPITGDLALKIRGRVRPLPGERVAAPDIAPLDMVRTERFLSLPTQVRSQHYNWETSGLIEDKLPEIFLNETSSDVRGGDEPSTTSYRALATRVKAAIEDVEQASGSPQVQLADIYIQWGPGDRYVAMASFDLEPADLKQCTLEMPAESTLIRAETDGLPVLLEPEGTSPVRYRLNLGSDHLPQRVVVLYESQTAVNGAKRSFAAPTLVNIPVMQTLWTITGENGKALPSSHHVGLARQEQVRLSVLLNLLERADNVLLESEPAEAAAWRRPWLTRYNDLQGRLSDLENNKLNDLFSQDRDAMRSEAASPASRAIWLPVAMWRERFPQSTPTRLSFQGGKGQVVVAYAPTTAPWWATFFWIVLLAAVVAAIEWLFHQAWLYEMVLQWPHAPGVLAGVAWWLFLSPSYVGLIIAGVSLVLSFASPWRGLRSPITVRA